VLAENDCAQLRSYLITKFPYLAGNAGWILHDENDYRSPVIAWPLRTHAFSPSFLPCNFFFSARTYAAVIERGKIPAYVGLFASKIVDFLLKVSLGRTGHPEFVTGVVRSLPIPPLTAWEHQFSELSIEAWRIKKTLNMGELTTHEALLPSLLTINRSSLSACSVACGERIAAAAKQLVCIQSEIDGLSMSLYGLTDEDFVKASVQKQETEIQSEDEGNEGIENIEEEHEGSAISSQGDVTSLVAALVDYLVGAAFGRWDIRIALDPSLAPKLPGPFAPLPVCPPGMLVGPDALPAEPNHMVSEEWLRARPDATTLPPQGSVKNPTVLDDGYPLRISWDGIVVDDPGFNGGQPHRDDIVRRVREVIDLFWKDKAHEIEQETCDILGVADLRDYFRKPTGFFHDHLKRYSKSRRKAPIYWQLATSSGSYAVWLYYHRFTKDTFYKVLNDYVKPKLQEIERRLTSLRQDAGPHPSAGQRNEIAAQEGFVEELRTFRDEVFRVAPLWRPDLNDGIIINFAPLWRLVSQHRQWQRECKECWDKLVKGDYDWAHLAMHLWPDRVVPKCAKDRSLAIAHGLEEFFWYEHRDGKWRPKTISAEEVERLIHEKTSPTVKAALNELLSSPKQAAGGGGTRSGHGRRRTSR
jgi:hypothetical protein